MRELKVALIGAGFMGKAHSLAYGVARAAENQAAVLVPAVIVDANAELAASFAEQLGWPESATDWRRVIARDDIDVVDICTPPQFHEEIALAAIEAGKHVFCEKPVTNDATEAVAMARAARAVGVVAQVGFNYRHTPAVGFARQLLRDGAIGAPLQVRASYLQDSAFGADPNRWRATKATGGSGTVGDIGSHAVDLAEYLCGDIVRVAARLRAKATDDSGWVPEAERLDGDLIDDAAVWIAEFESGVIGTFAASSYASGSKNRIAIAVDGTRGAVDFSWNDREVLRVSYVDEPAGHSGFRNIHTNSQHPDNPWRLAGFGTGFLDVSSVQFQKFARAITGTGEGGPDFSDAAHVQQVIEAITRAAESDSWIDVPRRGTNV